MDILEYILPDQAWSQSFHLETEGTAPLPVYVWLDSPNKRIWNMKGSGGYPWDMFTFDDELVYFSITENIYTLNTSFKMCASLTWPAGNGGYGWLPRQFTPGAPNSPIITADSTYRVYAACGQYTTTSLSGPTETSIEGPYEIDFGGTIGEQSAIVMSYKWNPGFTVMERNYFVQGYGLVQWEIYNLVSGLYIKQQTSAFNTEVAGGLPALSFPCGVPVI